jgi:DNA-directed RNA polymerase subunit alpha
MDPMRPEIKLEESTPRFGRIVVEPLERGYGVTLGNSLRRVLLSSIKGAAITAVRIEGVLHEYSTVPGLKEDVLGLMINLKHIPLRCHSPEARILHLEAEGPKEITAADIQPDSEVEFVDPSSVIGTLEKGHRLVMDLYVEQGTGYATTDRPRPSYLPIDALMVDAIFSPIQRVKYEVQNARVGQRTDYDRLVLEVWTNGVVSVPEAVSEACNILKGYFALFAEEVRLPEGEIPGRTGQEELQRPEESHPEDKAVALADGDSILARPIKDLELSVRSENCLLRGGVHTIGDLVSKSRSELMKIRNLGKISLREIEEKLEKFSISLPGDEASEEPLKED